MGKTRRTEQSSFSSQMEVEKLSAPPNLEVKFVSCNESAIERWLSSELEETVFSLTHELFMTKCQTVTLTSVLQLNNKKKDKTTSTFLQVCYKLWRCGEVILQNELSLLYIFPWLIL